MKIHLGPDSIASLMDYVAKLTAALAGEAKATKPLDELWAEHEAAERAARAKRQTLDELDPPER